MLFIVINKYCYNKINLTAQACLPGPYETLGSLAAIVFLGSRDPALASSFSGSRL
jgi:hypothetical protein